MTDILDNLLHWAMTALENRIKISASHHYEEYADRIQFGDPHAAFHRLKLASIYENVDLGRDRQLFGKLKQLCLRVDAKTDLADTELDLLVPNQDKLRASKAVQSAAHNCLSFIKDKISRETLLSGDDVQVTCFAWHKLSVL